MIALMWNGVREGNRKDRGGGISSTARWWSPATAVLFSLRCGGVAGRGIHPPTACVGSERYRTSERVGEPCFAAEHRGVKGWDGLCCAVLSVLCAIKLSWCWGSVLLASIFSGGGGRAVWRLVKADVCTYGEVHIISQAREAGGERCCWEGTGVRFCSRQG